jgi:hypothetical protein
MLDVRYRMLDTGYLKPIWLLLLRLYTYILALCIIIAPPLAASVQSDRKRNY